MCDFLAETDASRAENAALVIKRYPRAELHVFRLFDFVLQETRLRIPIVDAELLQTAFPGLIADRAIERVIDEEKFHDTALTFLNQRRVGANGHAFSYILCAANLGTWHPVDNRFAILPELRLAIGPEPWKSHFDEAHPAISGRAKFFVVAIARHENPNLLARLNHARALRNRMPDPIDLNI